MADLRLRARRKLPRPIFDYIDGGADDEVTLARNASSFGRLELIPDCLNDVSAIRTETKLFGEAVRWPLMLSPTRLTDQALALRRQSGEMRGLRGWKAIEPGACRSSTLSCARRERRQSLP